MYVPAWLLIVLGAVALLVYWRALQTLLLLLAIPLVLASAGFCWYYLVRQDYATALLLGSPFLVFGLWTLIHSVFGPKDPTERRDISAVGMHLLLNRVRCATLTNSRSIMESRLSCGERIGLGPELLRLYGAICHMPAWYESGEWTSSLVSREAISLVGREDLRDFGISVPPLDEVDPAEAESGDSREDDRWPGFDETSRVFDFEKAVVLRFAAEGKCYAFCAYMDRLPSWATDAYDEPLWRCTSLRVHVVELPTRSVLEVLILYEGGDRDLYRRDAIEAFLPGGWVLALFQLEHSLQAEEDRRQQESIAEWDREKAKRFI